MERRVAFPLEIFHSIVNEVAYFQPPDKKLQDVKACSLVCKAFVPFARAHIFGELYVSLRSQASRTYPWDRFFDILEKDPAVGNYVRKLTLVCWALLQPEKHTKYLEALLRLPNLHYLKINNWGTRDREVVDHFRRRLVIDNVSSGKLYTLDVQDVHDLPFDTLRRFPSLINLHLENCNIPEGSHNLPNIKHLEISQYNSFPIEVIFKAPKLTSLTLRSVKSLMAIPRTMLASHENASMPSVSYVGLTTLSVSYSPGLFSTLVDAYRAHGKDYRYKPFGSLAELGVDLRIVEDTECFKSLLPDLFSLQSLNISVHRLGAPGTPFSFSDLELEKHSRTTFNLKSLSISVDFFNHQSSTLYLAFLDELRSFFESISSDNELEHITIYIDTDPPMSDTTNQWGGRDVVVPQGNPWSRIDRTLASNSRFPKLKWVDVKLKFSGMEDSMMDVIDSTPGMHRGFATYLTRAMPMLYSEESGVKLTTEVDLIC